MASGQAITLRLRIGAPFAGVAYSLQDKAGAPVGQVVAGAGPVVFDVPVRVVPGPRFLGDFVRSEGSARRFVYVAIGEQAGQRPSAWSRRAKIDIHMIGGALLDRALAGAVLLAELPGEARDGGPACATVAPLGGWQAVT